MVRKPTLLLVYASPALALMIGACVTRKETIRIAADRSVTIQLEYEGGVGELDHDDAMPSAASGWEVLRISKQEEDEEKILLQAERTFAPEAELPQSYAPKSDPDRDLYLAFPTTLETEQREDGLYYHFSRVYTPRRWAYVHYWEDKFTEQFKDEPEKSVEDMTQEERVKIAKGLSGVEAFKLVEFAEVALDAVEADLAPDRWLRARRAVLDSYEHIDWGALVHEYMVTPEADRDAYFDEVWKRFAQDAHDALLRVLRAHGGLDAAHLERFQHALDRAERYYSITGALGGHQFEIRVVMPGTVVAHNADKLDDDGQAVWEFAGDAFRDRPFELLITSRVAPASPSQ